VKNRLVKFLTRFIFVFVLVGAQILGTLDLHAQAVSRQIQGYVIDTASVQMEGVTVRLTSEIDTLVTSTSSAGFYEFGSVKGTNIRIAFSMLGYQIINKQLPTGANKSFYMIPNVVLTPQSSLIEGVYVVKTVPVVYSTDTVQYNMEAFNFRGNSLLEEALKQLPGIQVSRDGTVYAHGKVISSVRVEGKKFFGGDVLTATRNLPADFIDKLQVINSYGENATDNGMKTDEPEKILNIVLKEDRKRISFGQVTAGGGTSERYIGSVGFNRFDDGQEFSVVGSINNTNTSLFSFGSPNGVGDRDRSLFDATDFVDPTDGLNNIKSLGFNFSDDITEKTQFNGSYSFSRKANVTRGTSWLRSNYVGNMISKQESYQTTNDDNYHRFTAEFKHQFKNNDIFELRPVFTYNKTYTGNNRDRVIANNQIHSSGIYRDTSFAKNPNLDVTLVYAKSFNKPGRKLIGNVSLNFNSNNLLNDVQDSYITIDSSMAIPGYSHFEQSYFIQQTNGTDGVKASLSYVEPFSDYSKLEFVYDYHLTDMTTSRLVEDKNKTEELGYFYYIDSLGVNYNYRFSSSRVGLNYQYTPNKRIRANLGFAVQPLKLVGNLPGQELTYTYGNVNLVPTAGLKWRLNKEVDWALDYIGKNNQPNFLHIIPVRDNSNSQNIVIGNPELKAEFSNRISTTFRKFISTRGQYFETNFAYNFVTNKIVSDKTATGSSTIQETTFRNADGYYDLKWYYLFNTPILNESLQLDLVGSADFYNNLSYVNNERNRTKQFIYSQSFQFRYTWSDYFETLFNTNYLLNHASYTWPYVTEVTAHSLLFSARTKGYLSDYITLGAEMSQRFNSGYESSFMNSNPSIINAYMEFSFFKNKTAVLRVQGFDLLDQNKNMGTYSEYIGNDLYEAKNNRLGRYFMMTLNVRLQKYPKTK